MVGCGEWCNAAFGQSEKAIHRVRQYLKCMQLKFSVKSSIEKIHVRRS